MLLLLLTTALAQHSLLPGAGSRWSYVYNTGEEAEEACEAAGLLLCTKAAFLGACQYELSTGVFTATNNELDYHSAGWFKEAGGYSRGLQAAGCSFSSWAPDHGRGTAHCCKPTYHNSGYKNSDGSNVLNPAELASAQTYCASTEFKQLCTTRQVRGISEDGESPDQGEVSSLYADGSVGYYKDNTQHRWDSLNAWPGTRGAHCCTEYAGYQDFTIPNYGFLPESEQYSDSTYWNLATAQTACTDAGYDKLCSVSQQAQAVADGARKCLVGWATKDDSEYPPGFWGYDGCGDVGLWNEEWSPYNDETGEYPGAHCCKDAQASLTNIEYAAYRTNLGVYQWSSKADAQAECRNFGDEYNLCSRGQLYKVATETFSHNGYSNTYAQSNMCNNGWTSENDSDNGEMTWYQVSDAEGDCDGRTGWLKVANAEVASIHCCTDFPADPVPTPVYETLKWASYDYDGAAAQCREGMQLCSRDQLAKLARETVTIDDMSAGPITSMCNQGWTRDAGLGWWQYDDVAGCVPLGGSDNFQSFYSEMGTYHCCQDFTTESSTLLYESRLWFYYTFEEAKTLCGTGASLCSKEQVYMIATEEVTYNGLTMAAQTDMCSQGWVSDGSMGWWNTDCADGTPNAWSSFDADSATFHCCLPFPGKSLPGATTTAPPVISSDMPSFKDQPEDCTYSDFKIEGFEDDVHYCTTEDGMVYMNGFSTCIPSSTLDLTAALTNSWENDWYMGATQECTGRDPDQTTDDQLWVTNKMCDNLDAAVANCETTVDTYMNDWNQDIKDVIQAAIDSGNYDADTAARLQKIVDDL